MLEAGDELVPGYRLEKFLGRGQFGEVWKTTAPGRTWAALKFIDLDMMQGLKEFRGIQRVKEIRHAHLMPITALWMIDQNGQVLSDTVLDSYDPSADSMKATMAADEIVKSSRPKWLVVAMLLGDQNLEDRLEEARREGREGIEVDELLRYMEEAAKGIDFLNSTTHDLGSGVVAIQHCDIKPANVMLVGDSIVICDFGLARMLSEQAASATATSMIGSPAYMAPECIARKPSRGTDQYSLAVSYVELRTGELPFADQSYVAVLDAHRQGKLDLHRLPEAEAAVIRKATSVNPEDRFPTSVAMVQALRKAVHPDYVPEKERSLLLPVLLVVIAALGIGFIATYKLAPELFAKLTGQQVSVLREESFLIPITPSGATITVNGVPGTVDEQGRLVVTLKEGQTVEIRVEHSPHYQTARKSFTFDQLDHEITPITLDFSARYYAERGFRLLDEGSFDAAVEATATAIQLGGSPFAAVPEPRRLSGHKDAVTRLQFAGANQLVSGSLDMSIRLWGTAESLAGDSLTPNAAVVIPTADAVDKLVVSSDGQWLACIDFLGEARVWQLATVEEDASALKLVVPPLTPGSSLPPALLCLAFHPQRNHLLVGGDSDGAIHIWDLDKTDPGTPLKTLTTHTDFLNVGEQVSIATFSSDGVWLATSGLATGQTLAWKVDDWDAAPAQLLPRTPEPRTATYSPDSRWLVVACRGSTVVYPAAGDTGKSLDADYSNAEEEMALRFVNQGQQLIGASSEGQLRVWPFQDGQPAPPAIYLAHTDAVLDMAVDPSNRWLVTCSNDGSVQLWEVRPEQMTNMRLPHSIKSESIAISPDGRWVATSDGNDVLVWDLKKCALIKTARDKAGYNPATSPANVRDV